MNTANTNTSSKSISEVNQLRQFAAPRSLHSLGEKKEFSIYNIRIECDVFEGHGPLSHDVRDVHCKVKVIFCDTAECGLFAIHLTIPFLELKQKVIDIIDEHAKDENTATLRRVKENVGEGNEVTQDKVAVLRKEAVSNIVTDIIKLENDAEVSGPTLIKSNRAKNSEETNGGASTDRSLESLAQAMCSHYGAHVDTHSKIQNEKLKKEKEERITILNPGANVEQVKQLTAEELELLLNNEEKGLNSCIHISNIDNSTLQILKKWGVPEEMINHLKAEDRTSTLMQKGNSLLIDQHYVRVDVKNNIHDQEIYFLYRAGVFIIFSNSRNGYISSFVEENVDKSNFPDPLALYTKVANDFLLRNERNLYRLGNRIARFSESIKADPSKKRPDIKSTISEIEVALDAIEEGILKQEAYVYQFAGFLNQEAQKISMSAISSLEQALTKKCRQYRDRISAIKQSLDEPKKTMMYRAMTAFGFSATSLAFVCAIQNWVTTPGVFWKTFSLAVVAGSLAIGVGLMKKAWWSGDGREDSV